MLMRTPFERSRKATACWCTGTASCLRSRSLPAGSRTFRIPLDLRANIAFYHAGESPESAVALIRVRVSGKADENTMGDLQADMDGYRQEYAGVAFEDIAVAHPTYRAFAKLFLVKDTFFEYVVYLNPGKGVPFILSVSMNKQRTRATKAEFESFQEVVRTLRLFNGLKVIEQKADAGAP